MGVAIHRVSNRCPSPGSNLKIIWVISESDKTLILKNQKRKIGDDGGKWTEIPLFHAPAPNSEKYSDLTVGCNIPIFSVSHKEFWKKVEQKYSQCPENRDRTFQD